MLRRVVLVTVLMAWTLLILRITLPWGDFRDHAHWGKLQWVPFVTPPIRLRDMVGNTLLYVPFGLLASRVAAPRPVLLPTLLLAATLSLATEATQLFSHRRFPSSTDLVCNLAGSWCGVRLASVSFRRSKPALVEELSQ